MSRSPTFHRYRLLRRIARGGMAEVFLALLRGPAGFERRIALKMILPVYSGMEEFGALFRDEARLSAQLQHSAIVQTYEFGKHEDDYFMAMEYVDGPDLEELLDRCRRRGILLPIEVVLHIVHQLTRALEYAHALTDDDGESLGIIHRDVSPPNVLIGVQGEIKLTDFGVAKAVAREAETRPGVLRGKYAYMSPEQVQQGPMDHRSDIFSVGIVLYEALTGVNPFEGTTDFQTMESVERAEVEPASFLRPDTPPELDRILLACLEPDPDLRYQNAGDLRRDLAEVIRALGADEGPEVLVTFLADVFPERAPDVDPNEAADLGAAPWEHLAHRLAPISIPVPQVVREAPKPPSRLVMGGDGADSRDETANEIPERPPRKPAAPPRSTPAALMPDRLLSQPGVSQPGIASFISEDPREPEPVLFDEWAEEQDNPDRVLTQPGVMNRAFGSADPLGPTFAAPREEPIAPEPPPAAPMHGPEDVPEEVLDSVREHTDQGVPVFNEWDFGGGGVPNLAHDTSLDLDDHPDLPKRQITQASGRAARKPMGAGIGSGDHPIPSPPASPVAASRPRLRPPGRPVLPPPGSTPSTEVPRTSLKPLDLTGEFPVLKDPTPPTRQPTAPESAPPTPDPPLPPPTRPSRPMWARAAWALAAILVPLGVLGAVEWLDERMKQARAPKLAPSVLPAPTSPAEPDRLEPLPPTEPQRPGEDDGAEEPSEPEEAADG